MHGPLPLHCLKKKAIESEKQHGESLGSTMKNCWGKCKLTKSIFFSIYKSNRNHKPCLSENQVGCPQTFSFLSVLQTQGPSLVPSATTEHQLQPFLFTACFSHGLHQTMPSSPHSPHLFSCLVGRYTPDPNSSRP